MTDTNDTVRVATLRQHLNAIGEHQIGDEYVTDRRHAEILTERGVVKPAAKPAPAAAPENKRRPKAPDTKG